MRKKLIRAAIALGLLGFLAVGGIFSAWLYWRAELPDIQSLEDYKPKEATRVFSDDGHLIAIYAKERRRVVDIKKIPKHVIQAFLAAEDSNFYQHEGLDFFGILRAAIKNLRPGAHLQGASTITQQTVKTLVLGPERSYSRKMREAILSRRLEQYFSKDDILHLYLNQIYFGSGAWGIGEASRTYFRKEVQELNKGEAAYLAAIPKNPSKYTIRANPSAAKKRQLYVLERMLENDWIDPKECKKEIQAAVPPPPPPHPHINVYPHYTEWVKRLLVEELGEEKVETGGLTVYTGLLTAAQMGAQKAIQKGLENIAHKHGFSGPDFRIEVDRFEAVHKALKAKFTLRLKQESDFTGKKILGIKRIWNLGRISEKEMADPETAAAQLRIQPFKKGVRSRGVVSRVDSVEDVIWIDLGAIKGALFLKDLAWARKFSPTRHTPKPRDVAEILRQGDVVQVEILDDVLVTDEKLGQYAKISLIPKPEAQGALVAIDPHTRMVRAMVGGYSQVAGNLIRAVQSKRQPGSCFKPVVYATGLLQKAITPASICPDSPVVIRDPWTGKAWKPENYEDGRYDGNITYRRALTNSKNTCSVRLIEKVGPESVIEVAKTMGISSKLPSNLTLALGTGDLAPIELCNAYATIASGGLSAEPLFIRKVTDSSGEIILEKKAEFEEVLPPAVAYVLTSMMESVVKEGTARRALSLERPLAGKTGTTNRSRNVWFSGFSPELAATVWVGFDDNSSLGRLTGSSGALPIWVDFMGEALKDVRAREFARPEGVVSRMINKETGLPSSEEDAFEEVFIEGTEPDEATDPLPSIFMQDEE